MPKESRMLSSRGPQVDSAMPPRAKSTMTALRHEETPAGWEISLVVD
jgi:hypothetical protein